MQGIVLQNARRVWQWEGTHRICSLFLPPKVKKRGGGPVVMW
jgi:hypothetical protein